MSTFDMTDEEIEQAAKWGLCEFCGGPRSLTTERSGPVFWLLLVCLRCGKQAS
jgi:hypothetical protein